ncbi:class I SAM-dependent methyltransferase [Gelidibacter japonicus]|uniref:class I SAM-dependent methyltransferase n=1 Tax=Gelidibacter japonicus TaxID=1962232 RepID=UPI0013D20ACB|nr:class I SAM-dependent methyltransferase [Gelidibacter japonicus]
MDLRTYIKKIFSSLDRKKNKEFPGSKKYWEHRYKQNRNSGTGSYGHLADFKAEILNEFVLKNNINKVLEFGCGDGNQLSLANYPNYIGVDVSEKAISICKEKFKNDTTKLFYHLSDKLDQEFSGELVLSLEVIFHLIEDDVFVHYMKRLFSSSFQYVIIYSSDYDEFVSPHVKCRRFTQWIENNISNDWVLKEKILNRYPYDKNNENNTSFSDFYIYEKV